jgi:hypothetical protein
MAEMRKAIRKGSTYEDWAKNSQIKINNKIPNILRPVGPPPIVKLRDAIEKGSYA